MKHSTIEKLDAQFAAFPIMKASELPPSSEAIDEASKVLGVVFHEDYVEFLERYGGGMVGSMPIYGLREVPAMGARWSVVETTMWFRNQVSARIDSWYVVSEDGFGNPIGIAPNGRVMIFDHDHNQEDVLAPNFEHFLIQHS